MSIKLSSSFPVNDVSLLTNALLKRWSTDFSCSCINNLFWKASMLLFRLNRNMLMISSRSNPTPIPVTLGDKFWFLIIKDSLHSPACSGENPVYNFAVSLLLLSIPAHLPAAIYQTQKDWRSLIPGILSWVYSGS